MIDCPGCDEWIATILASPAATPTERQCPDCGATVVLLDKRARAFATGESPHPLPNPGNSGP